MRRLFRALRLKQGLTQEQLAEKAGLDYKYYQRIELGLTEAPSLATLEGLGRALKVKPWLLLCDEIPLVVARTGVKGLGRRVAPKPGRPRKTKRNFLGRKS
jgi:transcriptional regulator with XRE-family HTH domain